MKSLTRTIIALLLIASLTTPAFAATHVIAELGNAPLLGRLDSTQSLRANVARNETLFSIAGKRLGLTADEYAQLRDRIASSELSYVTIPRHLDAMTWAQNGRVYAVRDVRIPANTKGWEIDLHETGEIVALFVPNKCGNLSLVRKPVPVVASVSPHVRVLAAATAPPAPAPLPPAAIATQAPVAPPEAIATTAPFSPQFNTPSAPQSSSHHFRGFLPILGLIAIGFLAGGSHSSSSPGSIVHPSPVTPIPVAACPTPAPAH